MPGGEAVPRDELLDDPNRIPGPELEIRGFVHRTGRPVEGALVRLCRAYPSGRDPEPGPEPFAETRTLDDGSFVARAARRSSLVIEVRHEGSATRRLFLVMPLVDNPKPVRIELAGGHNLVVRVIEPGGAPVNAATVSVRCAGGAAMCAPVRWRPRVDTSAPRAELIARTDEGRAVLHGVEPGAASIEVGAVTEDVVVPTGGEVVFVWERPGTVEGTLRRQDGQAVADTMLWVETAGFRDRIGTAVTRTDAEGRFRINTVPPGWILGGRVRGIERADGTPSLLRPGGTVEWNPVVRPSVTVRGRATTEDGRPLANVRVLLTRYDETVDVSWSDDAGQFELRAPEPGEYGLRAEAFGLLACEGVTAPCAPRDVRLVPCSRVVGRIRGIEKDDLCWVSLMAGEWERRVPLDAAGRFAFEHVPPLRNARIWPGSCGAFDVPAGAVVEIDQCYESRGVEAEHWGRIAGEVRDDEGRPVAGAVVTYPEYGFIDMKFIQPAWGNTAATDDEGRYELCVAPGWLDRGLCVAVARPGFAPRRSKWLFGKPQPGEIERLDFTLEPAAQLHGRVVDARGEPVRYAYVEARVAAPKDFFFEESTYTIHDGTFRFSRLPTGRCEIKVWDDETRLAVDAEMGEGEVVIALPESGTIRGIVVPTVGRSAEHCPVIAIATSGPGEYKALTSASGRFCLADLPPGAYDVRLNDGAPVRNVPTGTDDLVLRERP